MPAGVVKTLQGALIVAHQEYLLVTQFERSERSSACHVAGSAYIHPIAIPDALQFPFILTRVEVRIRRQAFGMFGKPVVAWFIDFGCAEHEISAGAEYGEFKHREYNSLRGPCASASAAYLTGQLIVIDGGNSIVEDEGQ
jgi:hypothetical protein